MRAYIFDIDGTIADGAHRVHHILKEPKDWDSYFAACGADEPIPHIIELANALSDQDYHIVLVSGRSDVCRGETERWLAVHGVDYSALYMRKAGDHQNDDKLKVELLAEVVRDGFEPIMAFDDRNRVVAAWRANGIPCAQVADGDF